MGFAITEEAHNGVVTGRQFRRERPVASRLEAAHTADEFARQR